jgi:hypothetical protein
VVAIEWEAREDNCIVRQARVQDWDESGITLEHSLRFGDDEIRLLDGAKAALQAFYQGNQTDDEEDNRFCFSLGHLPSYISSSLAQLLPGKRSLDFTCAGVPPPATIPIARINLNKQMPVHKENVAPQTARTLLLIVSTMLASS